MAPTVCTAAGSDIAAVTVSIQEHGGVPARL